MVDLNNHVVMAGSPFIKVQYLEKKFGNNFNKKGVVVYKLLKDHVYVIPSQVMSTFVNPTFVGNDMHISAEEYQWLCDSI